MGNKIMELLIENNVTQKELASILNIAPSTLNGYLKGHRCPDYMTLLAIADYFSVSTDFLLGSDCEKTLSQEEKKLIKMYKKLSPDEKQMAMEIMQSIFIHRKEN